MDVTSLLPFAGFVTGFIDSIAGGGGLITVPIFTEILGPGAAAIGTNKIAGASGALVALFVYWKGRKLNWQVSWKFLLAATIGSLLGAWANPYLPKEFFKWALIVSCPFLIMVLLKKDFIIQYSSHHRVRSNLALVAAGLAVGFYDGFFGPGGGTFMLIALIWLVKLPLMDSLILSKLSNSLTATASLISYQYQGYVHWKWGLLMSTGMIVGAFVGAKLNNKHAAKIMKPVMVFVVLMLMVRLIFL
jgi:uncharacterized membrane protein YfcA